MKHWIVLLASLLSGPVMGSESTGVEVSFSQPETFTDFKAANGGRNDGRTKLMAEIERFIKERAELWLPANQHLTIQFMDIDMAGRIIPLPLRASVAGSSMGSHGSAGEQRLVESPWPPRLHFTYQIHSEYGELLQEGSADISETQLLRLSPRTRLQRRDVLWYEKALLDSWMRELVNH